MKSSTPCRSRWLAPFLCSLGFALAATIAEGEDLDPIWNAPMEVGGQSVSLPAPSMSDSMNAEQQETVLKEVAGKYPLDRFLKDSIVAPFQLVRENLKNDAGERIGHRVDVWFVAYGTLQAIRDQELFGAMVEGDQSDSGDSGQALTAEELAARGLKLPTEGGLEQGFYRFSVAVIDRVLVQGVILGATQSTERSHFASVRLDERFHADKEFPNQWRHLDAKPDQAVPYSGLAGYAKATRLLGHGDAILVECHAVVHEPSAWFQGANLLSSKLPLVTQDAVRKFRRTLGKQ